MLTNTHEHICAYSVCICRRGLRVETVWMKRSRNSSTHANRTIWSANDQSNWTHIFVCICVCVFRRSQENHIVSAKRYVGWPAAECDEIGDLCCFFDVQPFAARNEIVQCCSTNSSTQLSSLPPTDPPPPARRHFHIQPIFFFV